LTDRVGISVNRGKTVESGPEGVFDVAVEYRSEQHAPAAPAFAASSGETSQKASIPAPAIAVTMVCAISPRPFVSKNESFTCPTEVPANYSTDVAGLPIRHFILGVRQSKRRSQFRRNHLSPILASIRAGPLKEIPVFVEPELLFCAERLSCLWRIGRYVNNTKHEKNNNSGRNTPWVASLC
jgi:hypothetical protein